MPLNSATATCERGFSAQNITKPKLCSRLGDGHLNELTIISVNGQDFYVFDYYEDAAQHFRADTDRML